MEHDSSDIVIHADARTHGGLPQKLTDDNNNFSRKRVATKQQPSTQHRFFVLRRRRRAGKMAALRSDMPGDLEVYAEVSGAVQTNGLFDEFTSGAATRACSICPRRISIFNAEAPRVRLNCYLNCEGVGVTVLGAPQGHGFIVKLPGQVDTIEEVLIHLQKQMKLDNRMLYASEMWTPDGKA